MNALTQRGSLSVRAQLAARHGFEPGQTDFEQIAAQFCKSLGLGGGVAGDAQIEAAKLAADVLGRAEEASVLKGGLDAPPSRCPAGAEQTGGEGLPEGGAVGAGGRGRVPETFVRGGGNERGRSLAGEASAPREFMGGEA